MASTGSDPDGPAAALAAPAGKAVPTGAVRRRVTRRGPDGRTYEVLAARRGVMMRDGAGGAGGGGGDSIPGVLIGFLAEIVVSLVLDAVFDGAAQGRPWKVKVYRLSGPFPRRLHAEVLPPEVTDPLPRMRELLDEYAPEGGDDLAEPPPPY